MTWHTDWTIFKRILGLLAVGLLAGTAAVGRAQEGPAQTGEPAAEEATQPAADVDQLIRQLDANRFAERQTASNQLSRLGAAAIPALEAAAQGASREVTTRAIDILKRHFEGGAADAKDAARQALERIQKGDNAVASRLAEQALNPEPEQPPPMPVPGIGGIAPAQIQIRMQAIGGANGQRIQVQNVNGVKTIEVQENGRKIKIEEDPNKGIQVEVTEKKDGKETTQKYAAKSAEELKKQHPEAHKIYDKYSQQQGGIQIQAIQLGAVPIQLAPRALRGLPRAGQDMKDVAERLEKVQKQLQEAAERIKAISDKTDSADSDALRKSLEQLQDAAKQLEETRQKIQP
ncbi:MAG: hypothetical protein J5I93_13470 [Pirellulaceae bacterium]|nr:hypothetical protein [Pirellulaceae bacterium]